MPGAVVIQQGAGHAEERGGRSVSHGGYRGRRGGAHETPKKDMAEVAGTGRRSRAASRLRADPISHRHPASSLGQPGGAASARPPCRAATDPAAWLGDCRHATGIWAVCPGLPVPAEGWVVTLLHALKARLMSTLFSQRAIPLHRALRGRVSPKMATALWLSRPAVREDVVPAGSATDPGTWRHCLMLSLIHI